jgi:uncharacterized membrane protein
VDRSGPRPPILVTGVLGAAGLAALAPAVSGDWCPTWALVLLALVVGALEPPEEGAMRAIWNRVAPTPAARAAAATLESVVSESMYLFGPALVGLLVLVMPAETTLYVMAALTLAGSVGFVATLGALASRSPAPAAAAPAARRAVALVLLPVLLAAGLWCASYGIVEVAVADRWTGEGSPAVAGLILAAISAGAVAGGLWFGSRHAPLWLALVVYGAGLALLAVPVAAAGQVALAVVAGAPSAIVLTLVFRRVADILPAEREVTGYGLVNLATITGLAVGPPVGGALVVALGTGGALLLAGVPSLIAAAVALLPRRDRAVSAA